MGSVIALQYMDYWHEWEFIWDRTGLCTRAGCDCSKSIATCNNVQEFYYDMRIAVSYSAACIRVCRCVKGQSSGFSGVLHRGNSTSNETGLRGNAIVRKDTI